jgi:hypothetical protein
MTASNYLENKVLDHTLAVASYTAPTSLYMALHTGDPGDAGTASEVVGGSYAPQLITFAAASSGASASNAAVTFNSMPATVVTHFSIRENSPSGNPLYVGPLSASQTLSAGQQLLFNSGQVTVSAD